MVELLQAGFENALPMPEVEFHTALRESKLSIQELLQKGPLHMASPDAPPHCGVHLPPPPLISCMDLPMQK